MSHEEKLMRAAVAATGDDSIEDVAEFAPKGSAAARGLGAVAGDAAASAARDLPARVCVAASPTTIYLLAMPNIGVAELLLLSDRHHDADTEGAEDVPA
jgi:hypothetical protein